MEQINQKKQLAQYPLRSQCHDKRFVLTQLFAARENQPRENINQVAGSG